MDNEEVFYDKIIDIKSLHQSHNNLIYRIVFKAKQKENNSEKPAALKSIVYLKEDQYTDMYKNEIDEEFKIMQDLNFKGISNTLKVYNQYKSPGTVGFYSQKDVITGNYFIHGFFIEYMELTLSKGTFKTEMDYIRILNECLKILCEMQKEQKCHRDIKLDNIFLNRNKIVKIGDFGTAKSLIQTKYREGNKNEQLLSIQGTFQYMAPELEKFFRDNYGKNNIEKLKTTYDPYRTDLYSLGICVMNLILNKNCLIEEKTEDHKFEAQLEQHLTLCGEKVNPVSPKMVKALRKMLTFRDRPTFIQFYEEFKELFPVINIKERYQKLLIDSDIEEMTQKLSYMPFEDFGYDQIALNAITKTNETRRINDFITSTEATYRKGNKEVSVSLVEISFSNFPISMAARKDYYKELNILIYVLYEKEDFIRYLKNYIGSFIDKGEHLNISLISHSFLKDFSQPLDELIRNEDILFYDRVENDHLKVRLIFLKQIIDLFNFVKDNSEICLIDLTANNVLIKKNEGVKLTNIGVLNALLNVAIKHNLKFDQILFNFNSEFIFWPPEFYQDEIYKETSDLWTLGVLIFQLFSDRSNPFKGLEKDDYFTEINKKKKEGKNLEINENLIYEYTPNSVITMIQNLLILEPKGRKLIHYRNK